MRVFAVMTTKDEADKHLRGVLKRLIPQVDGVFVYDDRSSDNTQGLARGLGAQVVVRSLDTPTFMQDESAFRTASYEAFAKYVKPDLGDWVLSIDADEMLVVEDHTLQDLALSGHANAYSLHKAEVWDVHPVGNTPFIRVDGFWGDIFAPRFFRWSDAPVDVPDGIMGCGSIPEWAYRSAVKTQWVSMLHYGYATQEDRVRKYARYFGAPGHNPKHINSILKHPTLTGWEGSHL